MQDERQDMGEIWLESGLWSIGSTWTAVIDAPVRRTSDMQPPIFVQHEVDLHAVRSKTAQWAAVFSICTHMLWRIEQVFLNSPMHRPETRDGATYSYESIVTWLVSGYEVLHMTSLNKEFA